MWKSITGYEGLYEVSDCGQIRSLSRTDCRGQLTPARVLKLGEKRSRDGAKPVMMLFTACKNRTRKTMYVHHVVAQEFIGKRPHGLYVCHKDGDATNNNASNLYYGTPTENMMDAVRHGTTQRGEKSKKSKLSESAVCKIKAMDLAQYGSKTNVAKELGVSLSTVVSISHGRNWGWLNAGTTI